jgi:hypothetical protein
LAKDSLAALASFCTHRCRRCLLALLDAQASYLIRLCNDVRASIITGVIGVIGVSGTSLRDGGSTASTFEPLSSAGGFGISRSTLSRLKGNNPAAAQPATMFLLVRALSLAGLYR